jgi:hypothetical protein
VGAKYRGNQLNSIGGPARLLIAPLTADVPEGIGDIIDLDDSEGEPSRDPVGEWRDIGMTAEGLTMSHQADTNNWDSQQFGRYRVVPTNYHGSLSTQALEITQQNKVDLLQASAGDDNAAGELVTFYEARPHIAQYRIAAIFWDQYDLMHASVFPLTQWDGSAVQQAMEMGQPQRIPFSFSVFTDSALTGPDGFGTFRIDFDEVPAEEEPTP